MTLSPGSDAAATATPSVIVTRPVDQAGAWVDALRRCGVPALALPLIGISPAADPAPIDSAWAGLADLALLVFVSPNAVAQFFARRPAGLPWPPGVRVASPGPGTSASLLEFGVPADCLIEPLADAPQFDSETLWLQLSRHPWNGERVLVVRGEGGREWLAGQLTGAGARVDFLAAYRRGAPRFDPAGRKALAQALHEPATWLFSSSEAIEYLVDAADLPPDALQRALAAAQAVTTHPRIAARARLAGFGRVLECRPSVDAVVACIQSARR